MSEIKIVDFSHPDSPAIFTQSLKDTGFGIVRNHPISITLINEAYKQWNKFFQADLKEKMKYFFDKKKQDGYVPMSLSESAKGYDVKDLKEFYHFYAWGRCPNFLKATTIELYQQLNGFAETLLQWVQENLPQIICNQLSMPLSEMVRDSKNTLYRPIHYPPLTGNEEPNAVRAAAHEDINIITVLPAATADGLQVLNSKNEWVDVACDPDLIIVNVGDMLAECTDGYFRATTHRVVNPVGEAANKPRLSMPLFLHARDEVRLSERHTMKSYLTERLKELGLWEDEENAEDAREVIS